MSDKKYARTPSCQCQEEERRAAAQAAQLAERVLRAGKQATNAGRAAVDLTKSIFYEMLNRTVDAPVSDDNNNKSSPLAVKDEATELDSFTLIDSLDTGEGRKVQIVSKAQFLANQKKSFG